MLNEIKIYSQNTLLSLYYRDHNDMVQGEYKSWFLNKKMQKHCFYKDGKLHGEFKRWNEDGLLKTHCYYLYGEKFEIALLNREELLMFVLKHDFKFLLD